MALIQVEHPLVEDVVTRLRSRTTSASDFRRLARRVTMLLAYEASRDLPLRDEEVETPLESVNGGRLRARVVLVPVLRAGMSMLEPLLELFDAATVGYVGMERDEETAVARPYYSKLPELAGRHVLLLDPMLATGGSAALALELLEEAGATDLRLLCIVAAPEGATLLAKKHPKVNIYTAALDRELNDKKFILPGLGDFGDRLYGT